MASQDPKEIIVGSLDLYTAAAVEAEDDVDATPSGNWGLLGTTGDENYSEAGITISHNQTIRQTRAVGATGPLKANRQSEDLTISVELMDFNLAQFTKLLNSTTPSTDTSPNIDYIGARRGADVTVLSLIARGTGLSPSGSSLNIQLYVPRAYQSGNLSPAFNKDTEAMLQAVFNALEYQSAATDEERFGRWVVETS